METQFWVTKTVWQRIPSRRARHRKAPTTETVQSIARYDQLPLSGRTQMLTASDFCCECTTVHQVRRSSFIETSIHWNFWLRHWSSVPYSLVRTLAARQTSSSKLREFVDCRTSVYKFVQSLMSNRTIPSDVYPCYESLASAIPVMMYFSKFSSIGRGREMRVFRRKTSHISKTVRDKADLNY